MLIQHTFNGACWYVYILHPHNYKLHFFLFFVLELALLGKAHLQVALTVHRWGWILAWIKNINASWSPHIVTVQLNVHSNSWCVCHFKGLALLALAIFGFLCRELRSLLVWNQNLSIFPVLILNTTNLPIQIESNQDKIMCVGSSTWPAK